MQEATFSVAIVRDIVHYVVAQGVDCHSLYRAAHLDPAWLTDPDRQVSGDVLKQLWQAAVQQTGDRDLGLHIGEAFDLSAIGIVGYVLFNCQTYGQVLTKLSQYTRLFSQGVAIRHQVCKGWVQCDCEIVEDVKNYLLDEPRQPIESTMAAFVTASRQLTGKALPLQTVWFQHSRPANDSEHHRIFQPMVQFSQPYNRLVFAADCLTWSVRSANANLLAVFETHAATLLTAQNQFPSYTQTVRKLLSQQLQGDPPTLDAIAQTLLISVRQLQRELQSEHTSYQQILDQTRQELALQYLQDRQTSIHDIAFLLGFSEPSAFHRAFKRWTGETPHRYRSRQLNSSVH